MKTPRSRLLRAALGLLGASLAMWTGALVLVLLAGARPVLRPADVILVMGAAQYDGRPSPVFRSRLDHALALYRQGLAPVLIFTGGVGRGDTVSEAEVGHRYARAAGVPDVAMLVERHGLTSAESVGAAAALMQARGLHTALAVSDSYHQLRLALLGRRAGIKVLPAPVPGAPIDRAPRTRWRYVLRESVLFPATALLGGR
ncbi:MAG: YdcF family protein [Gemmatimonadetes bacterium]|nr:YdcF family protein [Gemmatimonadota bacterium]